jgi:hypothetical protein
MAKLGELYAARWRAYSKQHMSPARGRARELRARTARMLAAGDYLADHFAETPAVLVFCFNPKLMAITDIKQDRVSVVGGASIYPASRTRCSRAAPRGSAACSRRCSARWSPRCARCSRFPSRGRPRAADPDRPIRSAGPGATGPRSRAARSRSSRLADRWGTTLGRPPRRTCTSPTKPEHIAILRETLRPVRRLGAAARGAASATTASHTLPARRCSRSSRR